MWDIFLQTIPFFLIIGLGYGAGKTDFFTAEATAWLTKFVFYFALSAMLFRFTATLKFSEFFDPDYVAAYLLGTTIVYLIATLVAVFRRLSIAECAVESQCAAIGNTGFLGVPLMTLLLGQQAIGSVVLCLAVDLIVFGSLIVILITGSRDGRLSLRVFKTVLIGLLTNPMIVSMAAGMLWSGLELPVPGPMNTFLSTLGNAATPGALFAIGASLASKSAERPEVALWLSTCKLVLHPGLVAICALWVIPVAPYAAAVMIATSALPVAGNVYILAQHYGVAPQRVSASILFSTTAAVITVSLVIGWVRPLYGG